MNKKTQIRINLSIISGILLFLTSSCAKNEGNNTDASITVTDIDGNVYHTVTLGTQVWMKENLRVTRYRNGDIIPKVDDGQEWKALTTGAYCNYDNNSDNVLTYGRLYNWIAVNDARNIAPAGWHVPTNSEWTALNNYLGVNSTGGQMKEADYDHWEYPNRGATNSSRFTALPAGFRSDSGADSFSGLRNFACWWASTRGPNYLPFYIMLTYYTTDMTHIEAPATCGMSVRCIKD